MTCAIVGICVVAAAVAAAVAGLIAWRTRRRFYAGYENRRIPCHLPDRPLRIRPTTAPYILFDDRGNAKLTVEVGYEAYANVRDGNIVIDKIVKLED